MERRILFQRGSKREVLERQDRSVPSLCGDYRSLKAKVSCLTVHSLSVKINGRAQGDFSYSENGNPRLKARKEGERKNHKSKQQGRAA